MKRSRLLIATGYWLALLLLVLPLLEPLVTLLPLSPGQIGWRLQAFGVLSQALLLPLLGAALAVGTAVLLGQRRVVRALAFLAFLGSVGLAAAAGLFVLDFVEYRDAVGRDLREYYRIAGVIYVTLFLLGAAFLLWLGAVSWRAAGKKTRRVARRPKPLVHPPGSLPPISS